MRFLIIEDDKDLNNILFDYILNSFQAAKVTQVYDGLDALDEFNEGTFDLVLLDVMLPGMNGFDVCKEIRRTSNTPIIMLSALSDEKNQNKVFELGIKKIVKKTYSPKIVIKKIEAVIQRYDNKNNSGYSIFGILKYDLKKQKIILDNQELDLNNKEFELFNLFIHNKGIILSRDTILNKIWGYDYYGDPRTVDTHIKRLRKKLKEAGSYIKTIYKQGYKLEE